MPVGGTSSGGQPPEGKPAGRPIGKRKSPDGEDTVPHSTSPASRRHDLSNNNAGMDAVIGVPVKLLQTIRVQDRSKAPKAANDGAESRQAEDGEGRARLVWSQELHNRFLNALSHLGLEKAVPKSILGLMEVDGMTRENIASHLQKYRIYLKKLGGLSSKDKVTVEQLQELHEENIRRMATEEAAQEAGVSVDESDSNAAVEQPVPRLRNVVDGIPITGAMHVGMAPSALKQVEKELLDPRNLQYPAVGLQVVPGGSQVPRAMQQHYHQNHHEFDLDSFEAVRADTDETTGTAGKEKGIRRDDDEDKHDDEYVPGYR